MPDVLAVLRDDHDAHRRGARRWRSRNGDILGFVLDGHQEDSAVLRGHGCGGARRARATSSACARSCWGSSTAAGARRAQISDDDANDVLVLRVGIGRKRLRLNAASTANAFDVPSSLFFLHADPPFYIIREKSAWRKLFVIIIMRRRGGRRRAGADATRTGRGTAVRIVTRPNDTDSSSGPRCCCCT